MKSHFAVKRFFSFFLTVVASLCTEAAEPVFQGKPESYWVDALASSHPEHVLYHLGSNSIAVLLRALDKNTGPKAPTIRSNAALMFVRTGDFKILASLLKEHADPNVRHVAANGLLMSNNREALASLRQAWNDPDPRVREFAVLAYGGENQDRSVAVPVFLQCLQDRSPGVRFRAAAGLQELMEDPTVVLTALRRALTNQYPEVRNAAAEALRQPDLQRALHRFEHISRDAHAEEKGSQWSLAIKVIDHTAKPVEGADVWIAWRDAYEGEEPADPRDPDSTDDLRSHGCERPL